MALAGVIEQAEIGQDHRVHRQCCRFVNRRAPAGFFAGLGKGIDGQQHLHPALASVAQAFAGAGGIKVEPGEMAGVGVVVQAQINAVGAVIHGGLQGGQVAGRTDQLW